MSFVLAESGRDETSSKFIAWKDDFRLSNHQVIGRSFVGTFSATYSSFSSPRSPGASCKDVCVKWCWIVQKGSMLTEYNDFMIIALVFMTCTRLLIERKLWTRAEKYYSKWRGRGSLFEKYIPASCWQWRPKWEQSSMDRHLLWDAAAIWTECLRRFKPMSGLQL